MSEPPERRGGVIVASRVRAVRHQPDIVGVPASFVTAEDIGAPGGTIANVGVHGGRDRSLRMADRAAPEPAA